MHTHESDLGDASLRKADLLSVSPIDYSRLFIPESLTQLYYTPQYSQLDSVQRRRYNHLYAAHTNEQFIFFEHAVGNAISRSLLPVLLELGEVALHERLCKMIEQEEQHQRMFEKLNQEIFPNLYSDSSHFFIAPSRSMRCLLDAITLFPCNLHFLLWIALFFEEFSAEFSRTVLLDAENSGMLEPRFVTLHRQHLCDEVHHVRLYPDLIRAVISRCPQWRRTLNGRILKLAIREMLAPKRSGIAVLRQLINEHSELRPQQQQLEQATRALKNSDEFFNALFAPDRLPVMHKLFCEFPEFAWYGYQDFSKSSLNTSFNKETL